ncbi:hypothetical protein [Candidatus Palauibacter soopunensis]|uniref:hypothetical protein n=1 Tax=Candidatus Palauibacter soopunensis TaxID=3056739 RepID=UPI002391B335|nr:hypothetical protein [Candidatus Palauibacter soopunensis]MDE2879906.1 hypothetical protein [Candidatus Palauibacter soopunensis]
MWKPAYRWKRYSNLTQRGIFIFWVAWTGSMVFSLWFWLPRALEGAYFGNLAGLVVTAWGIQFATLELLRLFGGSRETRSES